ncbi:MAG: MBL fold metallo-hydrolase [Deltaproteobacteria bacterium]|nr:MAG: MBL fold metallo-hydrolase [Deltaproteobacteria bacterium]
MRIYPVKLGISRCYLIQGEKGMILIDCGPPKKVRAFLAVLDKLSLNPAEIKLITLTHGHWDHIGSAVVIKNVTGAQIALHREEKEWLEKSLKPMPPGVTGWGRVLARILAISLPWIHIPAAEVDIVLDDREFPLSGYGIPGRIIPTPGHSRGSVSVLLDTGDAFVGDLAMNVLPLCLRPGLPIFAENIEQVRESWKRLLGEGAKKVYPAHGRPFPADVIRKVLQ